MKKTYTNAILLTSTAFVALMIATPLHHLSAQNSISIDVTTKVHRASIVELNPDSGALIANIDGTAVPVTTDASTTLSLANGNGTELSAFQAASNVYIFGYYDPIAKSIRAEKIVMRNRPKTERTSFSRAELQQRASSPLATPSPVNDLGLTVK